MKVKPILQLDDMIHK